MVVGFYASLRANIGLGRAISEETKEVRATNPPRLEVGKSNKATKKQVRTET